jgi:isoamylase
VETHADLRRFVRGLIHLVRQHQLFHEERFWIEEGEVEITWHGVHLDEPDWGDNSHSLAFELRHSDPPEHLHVMLNAYWEPLDFELPALPPGRQWHRVANTALPSPEDFADPPAPLQPGQRHYTLHPRSAAILKAL